MGFGGSLKHGASKERVSKYAVNQPRKSGIYILASIQNIDRFKIDI
jgi:hypothetical protein